MEQHEKTIQNPFYAGGWHERQEACTLLNLLCSDTFAGPYVRELLEEQTDALTVLMNTNTSKVWIAAGDEGYAAIMDNAGKLDHYLELCGYLDSGDSDKEGFPDELQHHAKQNPDDWTAEELAALAKYCAERNIGAAS